MTEYEKWVSFLSADEQIEWREETLRISIGDDEYYDMRGRQGYNFGQLEIKF